MFFFFENNSSFWYSPSHERFLPTKLATIKPSINNNLYKLDDVSQGIEPYFNKAYGLRRKLYGISAMPIKYYDLIRSYQV